MTGTARPLDGIRVLDFSHALAGPYCTMLLSDYGAEVYKLEARSGDMGRGWGPPFAGGMASFFLGLNRGKLGISFDLKQPEGTDLCLRLIDQMDVLIENFRPGAMDKLGLGYEDVRQRNPRLVYCSISGYGQNGPSRDEAAMDLVMQASSGLLSITGTQEGESVRCGYGVTDVTAGLFAVIGILLALARSRHDWSRAIRRCLDARQHDFDDEFKLFEFSWIDGGARSDGDCVSDDRALQGVSRQRSRIRDCAVGSEKLWSAFCCVLKRPEMRARSEVRDERGSHSKSRRISSHLLDQIFLSETAGEWVAQLRAAGIPSSLVRNFGEVVDDPQSRLEKCFRCLSIRKPGSIA